MLQINVFDVQEVVEADNFGLNNHQLFINLNPKLPNNLNYVTDLKVRIVQPGVYDFQCPQILDIIPISTKVFGKLGQGVTNTLVGVYALITGADVDGHDFVNFGSSAGIFSKHIVFDKPGTIHQTDWLIWFDVKTQAGSINNLLTVRELHEVVDDYLDAIRQVLKIISPQQISEKKLFPDVETGSKKKSVVLVKQVVGSGVMNDTLVLPKEPSGVKQGKSVMDLKNYPVILTPNEYRDGALHALT